MLHGLLKGIDLDGCHASEADGFRFLACLDAGQCHVSVVIWWEREKGIDEEGEACCGRVDMVRAAIANVRCDEAACCRCSARSPTERYAASSLVVVAAAAAAARRCA